MAIPSKRFEQMTPRSKLLPQQQGFHQPLPRWHIFARAGFELVPDYSDRVFIWGDNIRLAACSLKGEGYVHFLRPLHGPVMRAYVRESSNPLLLLEVTRYGAKFKAVEWEIGCNQIEEFIFEHQLLA
jgi:hypothetical protein